MEVEERPQGPPTLLLAAARRPNRRRLRRTDALASLIRFATSQARCAWRRQVSFHARGLPMVVAPLQYEPSERDRPWRRLRVSSRRASFLIVVTSVVSCVVGAYVFTLWAIR